MPRFHCPAPLLAGQSLSLPASAARHVQVLRLQPGQTITLFNGEGGEWSATITRMGRSDVDVMPVEVAARLRAGLVVVTVKPLCTPRELPRAAVIEERWGDCGLPARKWLRMVRPWSPAAAA